MSRIVKTALMAGVMSLAMSAAEAQHKSYYGSASYSREPESIIVLAPRIDRNGFNAPSKISVRQEISFADLDLRTATGADQLRIRVHAAARGMCDQLLGAYPAAQLAGTDCYASTDRDAMVRAEAAINQARSRP